MTVYISCDELILSSPSRLRHGGCVVSFAFFDRCPGGARDDTREAHRRISGPSDAMAFTYMHMRQREREVPPPLSGSRVRASLAPSKPTACILHGI